jgi:hypothetical protein
MAEHWWRAYDSSIDHPKLLKLSDAMHRAWFTLQCIASANGGVLPPGGDIALRLRIKPAKVAGWIAQLVAGGLIDREGDVFRPHNWDERQYKTDTVDPTAASRAKKYRDKKRDGGRDDRDAAVTDKRPDTEQSTEPEDRIGDASGSAFTEGSKDLASSLWKALGHETALSIPPELAGTDWRAIEWERAGWTPDLISAEAGRIGPGKPLIYYEKCFATAFAKRQAPLPVVEVREAEQLTVKRYGTTQKKPGVADVAKRWAEQFESQSGDGGEGYSGPIFRISN